MAKRIIGIDIGAETIKIVELVEEDQQRTWRRRAIVEHQKEPMEALRKLLRQFEYEAADGAAVTGRMSRQVKLPTIPLKQAQAVGFRYLFPNTEPATIVSIGSHGFSVLELRESKLEVFRENSRCSQGTGNFLRQLVERFNLSIEEASEMCANVSDPAPLSGRCPVILKTDMTHLANKGESKERILAGLYDAVCENVQVLIKPRVSPQTVVLIGGVSRADRIRQNFARFLAEHEMTIMETDGDDALFVEALGCACLAADDPKPLPSIDAIVSKIEEFELDKLPPASAFRDRIRRLKAPTKKPLTGNGPVVLGYDIGSTGSKVVALDATSAEPLWEGYINTNGAPVSAAQTLTDQFLKSEIARRPVVAVGATGSGREIVGSLMSTCFGPKSVYVLNEIAAHAEGALHFDKRVDTIFEIGGQDAKYIRLSEGRVVDAAMNEACSAGTGSFIEEQGKKFQGIENVVHLGEEALKADFGVSLGQHCSVFMAEIIDEAVAAEMPTESIVAGIYDSIIQNYLNRVKGSRSVGNVIFCQGMPFSADALAAAVVRQTNAEVVIPPNPGTIGALGIALLTLKELSLRGADFLDLSRFLKAEVVKKDTFVCKSTKGCGGAGNKCRIDRLTTIVDGTQQKFTWGGGCSMYDSGTGKKKLPDKTPDPFREREELVENIRTALSPPRGRKTVAITDEFTLKNLFPFFATFIHDLGFDLVFHHSADQSVLKRGIEDSNVPFCAPMQQYHGLVSIMAEGNPDFLFLPMVRNIERVGDESIARLCPIVQGSADMLKWDVELSPKTKIISPVINFGRDNFDSKLFIESCRSLAFEFGIPQGSWEKAFDRAVKAQESFEVSCLEIGDRALAFCKEKHLTPVVVLGRSYTIYNTVLNSNVPYLLREQGAVPIPVDCYRVSDDIPIFHSIYWGYAQRNLRAAQQIRRTDNVYSLFCSNYSCGPDSFSIHFYSYIMAGKPFAVIETDGHSGDAGTKTRIEAFLYCVHEDLRRGDHKPEVGSFKQLEKEVETFPTLRKRGAIALVPRMGEGATVLAACLRGIGVKAEALPMPDRETMNMGRRHTSGKECIPLTLTLGALVQRVEKSTDPNEHFSFFMPTATGPCRFGCYNILQKIVMERLGHQDRVRFWAPIDDNYFDGVDDGFAGILYAGFVGIDLLLAGLYDVRPVETEEGAADKIFQFYQEQLLDLLERETHGDLTAGHIVAETMSGRMFGITNLLSRAAKAYKKIKGDQDIPTVLVVGELYVRCDPASNDFVIKKLEKRGIRGRFAAFYEWLEYTDYQDVVKTKIPEYVSSFIQATIQHHLYLTIGSELGWPRRTTVQDALVAASPYIRENLSGEAVLTLGSPLHEWREGHIDGAVAVGPLECMPNKIAEAQFFHAAEKEGIISLTLSLNGDPIDPAMLDNFAYEVHAQHRRSKNGRTVSHPPTIPPRPSWVPQSKVNIHEKGSGRD
jgi:predicted CoA-substrate-specific enzyme activase